MKSKLMTLTLSLFLLLCFYPASHAQNQSSIPQDIVISVKNGDAIKLSVYFNENIEIILPEKSGIFSKSQAQMVLKEFFAQNPPKEFKIIHEGSRQNASFAIGNYTSTTGVYRIYFLTKKTKSILLIHQLRIEK